MSLLLIGLLGSTLLGAFSLDWSDESADVDTHPEKSHHEHNKADGHVHDVEHSHDHNTESCSWEFNLTEAIEEGSPPADHNTSLASDLSDEDIYAESFEGIFINTDHDDAPQNPEDLIGNHLVKITVDDVDNDLLKDQSDMFAENQKPNVVSAHRDMLNTDEELNEYTPHGYRNSLHKHPILNDAPRHI